MTTREWWDRIWSGAYTWRDVMAFNDLTSEDRQRIRARVKTGLRSDDPKIRQKAWDMAETIYASEPVLETVALLPELSRHIDLEIAAVFRRGGVPLPEYAPVPRCGCQVCTGIPPERGKQQLHVDSASERRRNEQLVEAARRVTITAVAGQLGFEVRRSLTRCPFHDDNRPSLHLNDNKGRAFCNVCGRSWDGISLVMEYRRSGFMEAVAYLTGAAASSHGRSIMTRQTIKRPLSHPTSTPTR